MSDLKHTVSDEELAYDAFEHTQASLSKTVGEESFEEAAENDARKVESLKTVGDGSSIAPVKLPSFSAQDLYCKLPELLKDQRIAGRRYAIGELLGSGGNGQVFDLRDNNFDRNVAVKLLASEHTQNKKTLRKFINEALITSQLDHPNILPIYDLDVSEDGSLFYTMKKVSGDSLSEAINDDSEELDVDEILRIFIKVCEAVSYAHSLGVIHQDIKPSNIMLGAYGEVRIVDWGTAIDTKQDVAKGGRLVGTPMYMSPEQSRREPADERSDIYCLGASLYHALTARFPIWHDSNRVFWQYKKEGVIDPLSDLDQQRIPKPIIAIMFKCMDPEPDERYQSVEALAEDLKNYQAGLSVAAYHYSLFEFLKQWTRGHREAFAASIIIAVLIAVFVTFAYVEYTKGLSGWGKPIISEQFENDVDWRQRWRVHEGSFSVKDQRLVTTDGPAFLAFYNEKIYGSVAIEFDGEMLPGSPPCDLSVAYVQDFEEVTEGYFGLKGLYLLQNGGYHNTCSMILGPSGRLDYANKQLENARTYKVRAEIDGNIIRLFLDGELICQHEADFPSTSGYIGLYGYFHDKAFDNVKIYQKNVAEKVSILETGDVFYTKGLYQDAIERYKLIVESHKGTAVATEAMYKAGLCYYQLEQYENAQLHWSKIRNSRYETQIRVHTWKVLALQKDFQSIIDDMHTYYPSINQYERKQLHMYWSTVVQDQIDINDIDALDDCIAFWERHFSHDPINANTVTEALITLGKSDLVYEYFSDQVNCMMSYYDSRGEFNKIIDDYPQMRHQRLGALSSRGEHERILREYPDMRASCANALIDLGRFDEALARYSDIDSVVARVMLLRGQYDEVVKKFPEHGWGEYQVYYRRGQLDVIEARLEGRRTFARERYELRMHEALKLIIAGRVQEGLTSMRALNERPRSFSQYWGHHNFAQFFMLPAIEQLSQSATREDWQQQMQYYQKQYRWLMQQNIWYTAGFLTGTCDQAEWLAQPNTEFLLSRTPFYAGLKADVDGNRKEARKQYRLYLKQPVQSYNDSICMKTFAQWRIKALM